MNKATKQISKLFAAMAMAGVASYSVAADTIKIGLAGPVTGAVAQYGEMQFIGAKMAIEQINKAGGVNGAMLEGLVYDDACYPKQAVAVANKIVNGEGIATAVKQSLEGKGIRVALFEGINAGDKDFSAMIARLKQAGVDFVYS